MNNKEITLQDQIAYFDEVLKNDTESKRFIIAIPTQNVRDEQQYQEALMLAEHIKQKMDTELVEIMTNCFQIKTGSCQPLIEELDFLVFLHEFLDGEEEFIVNTVRNSRHLGVNVIDLEPSAIKEDEDYVIQ